MALFIALVILNFEVTPEDILLQGMVKDQDNIMFLPDYQSSILAESPIERNPQIQN